MGSFFIGLGKMKFLWILNQITIKISERKNLSKPRWENYQFLWLLISFSGRTKQIFFLVIKLEPRLLSWLHPRKNNCVPTELDVSISAIEKSDEKITQYKLFNLSRHSWNALAKWPGEENGSTSDKVLNRCQF